MYSIFMSIFNDRDLMERLCKFSSVAKALRSINMSGSGKSYQVFYKYCDKFDLVPPNPDRNSTNKISDLEVFIEDSEYTGDLKKRLLDTGEPYKCELCGLGALWNNMQLVLQLDHRNGSNRDNRQENLRFLCPNCHSQTPTFCGKNKANRHTCEDCPKVINKVSKRCKSCAYKVFKPRRFDVNWPSDHDLALIAWEKPLKLVAKDLGVSYITIKKRCKRLGIETPPRGYWSKTKREQD